MILNKKYLFGLVLLGAWGCTKLDEKLNDSFILSTSGGSSTAQGVLTHTYNDLANVMHNQDQLFSLEENTSDECLVPTRGGDWDDNGVWRVLHAHAWDATHAQSSTVFTNLGVIESDATTTLALNPSTAQAAQATFLRCFAQFYFLDLYGQVPYRTVAKYNSIDASPVMNATDAIDSLVTNLTSIIPQLTNADSPYIANANAARFLLMKVLLNKQAFLNRKSPAADVAADMQQVHALGAAIVASGHYSLTPKYFDNFGPNNGGFGGSSTGGTSTERIFAYANNGTASYNGIANADIDARWMMGLHYNSWDGDTAVFPSNTGVYGNAGWNGFSTIADVYNAFDASDTRRGNFPYPAANGAGVSPYSGLNVGMLEGQQKNEKGQNIADRKGNPLNFAPGVSLVETNVATLEGDGIRVIKYYPDYAHYTSTPSNQLVLFRYADVLLMMAEADLRGAGTGDALSLVNQIHAARGAASLSTITLVNKSNLYDGTTLLEERQKELYWESWRRQDLIRFGVFLQPWALKTADDPKYLLFPIPTVQLVANPNLKQNPGY